MSSHDLQPDGEKIRKAVRYICDILQAFPERKRGDVVREAERLFDLSPRECAFLDEALTTSSCPTTEDPR